jgi:hypothetical protein
LSGKLLVEAANYEIKKELIKRVHCNIFWFSFIINLTVTVLFGIETGVVENTTGLGKQGLEYLWVMML